jgi:hypothetical protein
VWRREQKAGRAEPDRAAGNCACAVPGLRLRRPRPTRRRPSAPVRSDPPGTTAAHSVCEHPSPHDRCALLLLARSPADGRRPAVTVVLGAQWGDEGKGKLVDVLAADADVCARCAGGNNAGHTIVANGRTFAFHLLPSGLVNPGCAGLLGNGVVIHLPSFFEELEALEAQGACECARVRRRSSRPGQASRAKAACSSPTAPSSSSTSTRSSTGSKRPSSAGRGASPPGPRRAAPSR